jgi:hypothetical protein
VTEIGAQFLLAVNGAAKLVDAGSTVIGRVFDGTLELFGQAGDLGRLFDTADLSPAGAESELARLFAGWVPEEVREAIASCVAGVVPDPPGTPAPSPPSPPADAALLEQVARRLADQLANPGAVQAVSALGGLPAGLLGAIGGIQPPPGSRWDIERIAQVIREFLVDWLHKLQALGLPGENSKRVLKEIDMEITGPLQKRAAIAGALSIGAVIGTSVADLRRLLGVDSSPKVGMEVHERLQRDYRLRRPTHLIVQESIAYQNGLQRPLKLARKTDDSLLALWWARDAYLLRVRSALKSSDVDGSSLRDDIIDLGDLFTAGRSFEIKTIRGAAFGVIQEFAYRSLFNLCVALLKDLPALHAWLRSPNVKPIHFSCEHVEPGTRVQWPEVVGKVMTASARAAEGGARTIMVFTIDTLPGLILYVRYDIPAAVVALLAKEFVRDLNKAADEFSAKVRTVLAWALVVSAVCVLILAAIVIVLGAVLLAGELAVAELLLALSAALARLGAELPRIVEALRRLVDAITPVVQRFGVTMTPVRSPSDGTLHLDFASNAAEGELPTAGATLGPLRLDNCPLVVLSVMDDVIEVAGPLAAAAMLKAATTPPTKAAS